MSPEPPPWKTAARFLLVAAAYFAAARAGLAVASFGAYIALLWLPAGLAVAAILRWGGAMAAAVPVAMLALGWKMGTPATVVLVTAIGNTLGPLLAVHLLRRFGFEPSFGRWRDVAAFCIAAATGMLVPAGAGAVALAGAGLVPGGRVLAAGLTWWMGDVLGVLVAAPPLVTASAGAFRLIRRRRREFLGWALAMAALGGAIFLLMPGGAAASRALGTVPLAATVWAALRFGVGGGSLAVLALGCLAAAGTAMGRGPFGVADPREGMLVLWAYVSAAVLLALTVVVIQAERARALAALEKSRALLEAIGRAQSRFIAEADLRATFGVLLGPLLELTCSEHGFLAEATEGPSAVLHGLAASGPAWEPAGLAEPLREACGRAAVTGRPERALCHGKDFTALPIFHGGALMGMAGLGGGDGTTGASLGPFLAACGGLIAGHREHRRRKEAEQRLELATQAAALGIWDYDASRDHAEWDARMLEIYGLRPEEFGGNFQAWERTLLPEDAPAVKASLTEAISRREDFAARFRIRRPDGEVRHVEARAILLPAADGTLRRLVGVNRDATAERRAEERRDELLARLQKIATQLPGVVYQFRLRPNGSAAMPYASGGLRALFGVGPERVRDDATLVFNQIHPDDLAGLNESIARSAGSLGIWRHEFRVRAAPGQPERWLQGNSAPQREPDGSVLWHGFITDVTERKRAERDLREKNEELERFAHTVSHDLKSPLVTIQTFLGYLEQDLAQGEVARVGEDLGFIRTASAKMSQLIEEVLEISRVGRAAGVPARVGFHDLAREVTALTAGAIAARGVEVRVAGPDLPLAGDRARLVQVWQNLVENAVKFMGKDEPAPFVELGARQTDAGMIPEFWVRDNGPGIEPRYHARVFRLFEQLDAAVAGTGLGLALVRRIVESFGGRIWLESSGPGSGACFRFTLPEAVEGESDPPPA